jgi:hypothetical protein
MNDKLIIYVIAENYFRHFFQSWFSMDKVKNGIYDTVILHIIIQ